MTLDLRKLGIVALASVLGLVTYWLVRPKHSDEDIIGKIIDEMRVSAEARKPPGITTHLDQAYRSDSGATREEAHQVLVGYLLTAQSIGVSILKKSIQVTGVNASVDLSVLLSRDGQRDGRRIVLRFAKTGDDWKIIGSRHEPLVQ